MLAGSGTMGPGRLRLLLTHHTPDDAVERLSTGRPLHPMFTRGLQPDQLESVRQRVGDACPREAAEICERNDVTVVALGDQRYPAALAHDPDAPAAVASPVVTSVRRVSILLMGCSSPWGCIPLSLPAHG